MIVDIHTHFVARELFEGLDGFQVASDSASGDRLLFDGRQRGNLVPRLTTPSILLEDMDQHGIDVRAVLTASWLMGYWLDSRQGEQFCRRTNDTLAELVASYPQRLVGLAAVPLQDPDLAIRELRRAVEELGLRGVAVGTNVNGRYYDEDTIFPFLEAVQDLDVPIFFHPDNVAGADRVGKYYLRLLLGNPQEATISLAHLVLGGVLERLPRLKPVVTMGGGSLTALLGRIEHGWRTRPEARAKTSRPPREYLKQVYFDTICHATEPLELLLRVIPPSQILFGNDYPWDMGEPVPGTSVRECPGLTEADRAAIMGGTAAKLLKLTA